jgi:hypothetical protein
LVHLRQWTEQLTGLTAPAAQKKVDGQDTTTSGTAQSCTHFGWKAGEGVDNPFPYLVRLPNPQKPQFKSDEPDSIALGGALDALNPTKVAVPMLRKPKANSLKRVMGAVLTVVVGLLDCNHALKFQPLVPEYTFSNWVAGGHTSTKCREPSAAVRSDSSWCNAENLCTVAVRLLAVKLSNWVAVNKSAATGSLCKILWENTSWAVDVAWRGQKNPLGQITQADMPGADANLPATQSWHAVQLAFE